MSEQCEGWTCQCEKDASVLVRFKQGVEDEKSLLVCTECWQEISIHKDIEVQNVSVIYDHLRKWAKENIRIEAHQKKVEAVHVKAILQHAQEGTTT